MGMRKIDRRMDCPWCGNDMMLKGILNNQPRDQKCTYCRRWATVTPHIRSNKVTFEVEAKDFPEPEREPAYKDRYAMSQSGLEYGR